MFCGEPDKVWETKRSLLTQEGGRVAVAQYRAPCTCAEAPVCSSRAPFLVDMQTRQGRRDIPAGRAPLSRFAAPSSPPPTAGARIPLPFQSFSVFFRVGCPLGFFVPTPGAPVPPGSSSVGGDLQQYGLPSGPPQEWASQAHLRTGPSLVKLQTFKQIRFSSVSLRVTAALTGVQGDTPDAFRGTPDSL